MSRFCNKTICNRFATCNPGDLPTLELLTPSGLDRSSFKGRSQSSDQMPKVMAHRINQPQHSHLSLEDCISLLELVLLQLVTSTIFCGLQMDDQANFQPCSMQVFVGGQVLQGVQSMGGDLPRSGLSIWTGGILHEHLADLMVSNRFLSNLHWENIHFKWLKI